MITNDLVIKIIDFNTAKIVINETSQPSQAAGTKDYMSPEIRKAFEIRNQSQYISPEEKEFIEKMEQESIKNFKADIYSIGLTILSLITDKPLFDLNLKKNQSKLKDIIESINHEWLKPILSGMLEFDHNKRYGIKDLMWASTLVSET